VQTEQIKAKSKIQNRYVKQLFIPTQKTYSSQSTIAHIHIPLI